MNRWIERGLWLSLSILTIGWLIYAHYWINKAGPYVASLQDYYIKPLVYQAVLATYFGSHFMLVRSYFSTIERLEVTTMLWRLFLIGMGGVITLLVIFFVYDGWLVGRMSGFMEGVAQSVFFTIGIESALIFFLSGLFTFRRFILYQKNKAKVRSWKGLFIFLGIALLFTNQLILQGLIDKVNIYTSVILTFAILYGILLIYLGTLVRWIGFLNLNQKLRALGLLLLILAVGGTFIASLINLPSTLQFEPISQGQLAGLYLSYIFPVCLAGFTFVYAAGAILILFFNLPTSSVFEQKRSEIASFNKINQSIQSNLRREEVLKTTLEASILSSNAEAGWIDRINPDAVPTTIMSVQINDDEVLALSGHYNLATRMAQSRQPEVVKNTRKHKAFRASGSIYRSLLGLPVITDDKVTHAVFVVSTLSNAFEEETLKTLQAYAAQAGSAIENAALIQNAISLERYQEQLKIAKDVQEDLLPTSMPIGSGIEFRAFSETAEEVGGDYFDILPTGDDEYHVAIGDVSGKGTKAAFYMAEVKGIFHALAAANVSPVDFVRQANKAVSACFQPGNFVTLSYLHIDAKTSVVNMIRAGHCPAMIYKAASKEVIMCRQGTLALGMVGASSFDQHLVEAETIQFDEGDIMLLYTDGIIEARDAEGASFGYEKLENIMLKHAPEGPEILGKKVVEAAQAYSDSLMQDDYTILAIRFSDFTQPQPS
ncbi:MAG: PP2C family protein-serine/threonine phosphatase [Bacteroidia bacterium]